MTDRKPADGIVNVTVLRRLGDTPEQRGSLCNGTCPAVYELSDGRFAFVGTDVTDQLIGGLPPDAGCADYERIVVIPREVLVNIKWDIPGLDD